MGLAAQKWGEGLGGINEIIAQKLSELTGDAVAAVYHADQITLLITQQYGGDQFYIPKAAALANHYRDQAIAAEFNGANTHDLAKKYHLTARRIREIVKK